MPGTLQWYAKGRMVGVAGSGTTIEGVLSAENLKKTIKHSLSAFYYYHLPVILNNVSDKMPFLKISMVGLPLKLLSFNINNVYLCYIITVHKLIDMFIS